MAESTLSSLVEKFAKLVGKEVKLLKGVREEFELIKQEFERMKAFLASAESSQEDDPELKVWVKQVVEVAYDTEDILDEFMLKLARDHRHGFMGYFRKIKSFIQNLKARHHISSEIADIKSRISCIGEGHRRYHFKSYCTEQSASSCTRGTSRQDLREDAFLVEECELVGIDEPREEIIKWLINGKPGLEVVSILGMGGLGKTTLAGRVYKNRQVKAYFQSHAWINISKSYEIDNILRDMIIQLHRENQQSVPQIEIMRSTSLKQMVKDFLQQKRYLIVLDDVWDKEALEGIKNAMPDSSFCSRLLITTRVADVTTVLSNKSKVYSCKPLSSKDSWSLFCKKAFWGEPCPPHLEDLARQILKKCDGLPLAIVAIGGLLLAKDAHEWKTISSSLAAELESNDKMQNFRKILSLSYNDLHYNLKGCFLYFGVFPEDHVIECMRLIRLWIAEGFVEEREGMTREEVAEGYLKELINRSLVQIAETYSLGRIRRCKVHDLMRENILSRLRDQNFVCFASEQKKELHEKVRRLSVQYTYNNALSQLNLPRLHSLLIFQSGKLSTSEEQFFPIGSKMLRVLDLTGASLQKFPSQILVLFHLKYLSLRGTNVCIIPSSIGKLQNLETLDLKHTLVSELPVEITKLKKLQYLLVYNYTGMANFSFLKGFLAPQGIGLLTSLQKLTCVKAGGGQSKTTMQELGELIQLRRLGVMEVKTDDAKELCHSLEKITDLRTLSVTAESESEVIDLDFLSSPPLLLRTLNIQGRLKKLPHWLSLLNNLAKLNLAWTRLKSSPLIAIQYLPHLVKLSVADAFEEETLVIGDRGFPKLKTLLLADLKNLRFVSMHGQAMPCLQTLIIDNCKRLDWRSLLVAIHGLTLLTYLQFGDMPEEFALAFFPYSYSKAMREGILQKCYEDVMERKPELYFIWQEEDCWVRYDLDIYCYNVIKRRVMTDEPQWGSS